MNDKSNVIDINRSRKGVIFRGQLRNDMKRVVLKNGITDTDKIDDTIEQIEQVICTSMVMAARGFAERLAAKAFDVFTQDQDAP